MEPVFLTVTFRPLGIKPGNVHKEMSYMMIRSSQHVAFRCAIGIVLMLKAPLYQDQHGLHSIGSRLDLLALQGLKISGLIYPNQITMLELLLLQQPMKGATRLAGV